MVRILRKAAQDFLISPPSKVSPSLPPPSGRRVHVPARCRNQCSLVSGIKVFLVSIHVKSTGSQRVSKVVDNVPYSDRYWEQWELRGRVGIYFASIEVDDLGRFRRNNPSAPPGYMNEKFKPVFWEYRRLTDAKSRKLNLRAVAMLMDSFSETLISSGLYRQDELSAFWAAMDDPQKLALHSVRLKKLGASTLSRIVAC